MNLEQLESKIFSLQTKMGKCQNEINELRKHANTMTTLKALVLAGGDDVSCLVEIKLEGKSVGKTPIILSSSMSHVFKNDCTKALAEAKSREKELKKMNEELAPLLELQKQMQPEE